jgi:hypothetical protein
MQQHAHLQQSGKHLVPHPASWNHVTGVKDPFARIKNPPHWSARSRDAKRPATAKRAVVSSASTMQHQNGSAVLTTQTHPQTQQLDYLSKIYQP